MRLLLSFIEEQYFPCDQVARTLQHICTGSLVKKKGIKEKKGLKE